ncbi:protein kinase [Luteimonas sp. BDR2-5]|uniref:bifunctional serine/threonine-protein kinase/formylglycine-generating enzyme family protein n=1 Tax=Proluteimonas luteida TaxID=2878685 RepID=UPI001E4378CE|nr:bifunctional serine/threonine-protein kinase/formylglycine-generating enzyme family protein [Luteimonas sp. BDR2-5]MCD9027879.1 protein kinase [Luteimonas sp. BDR2-5]
MSEGGTDVVELMTALRRGDIDLGSVLNALSRRGVLPEAEYSAGVETLWRFREELDETTLLALRERLDAMRAPGAAGPAPGAPVAADDDATVVMPLAGRPASPSADAGTPEAGDDVTRVVPRAPVPRPPPADASGGIGTGTHGSAATASWAGIADAAAGETATVGMLLKGRFLLERELGRGGMGVVFLARDERKVEAQDRDPYVAVKVLNDEFRRHPDSLVALQRESRRSQRLAHDNIVRVYDFDKAGTIVYMTMEYIDGSDLRMLIRERAFNGMPLARARPLIEGMCRALGRAHAAGVVHSDFKPGNVMVAADGVPKVFDFGIARAGKAGAGAAGEVTVFDASTLGALTPAYASLEMIEGAEPAPSDDIYALGCVCFELLTGRHPFDKASAEVALREGRTPPKVPGLTRRQYRTLCRAVAFRAADRLPGVEALLDGLREVPARERLLPLAGYGAAAALVVGGAVFGASHWLHQRQLAAVVAGFSTDGEGGFADEGAAMAALAALAASDRDALVLAENQRIESFLLRRLDALWNPRQGRYDYVQAQKVFALRNDLRLFSPALDERARTMAVERDELLNALDTELSTRIAAGRLFSADGAGAADTLERVRAVDPSSALLRHPGLELAYADAVRDATEGARLALAGERLRQAQALFPDSLRLQLAGTALEAAVADEAGRRQPAVETPRDAESARTLLSARIAQPSDDPRWQAGVAAALQVLDAGPRAPGDAGLREALARAIAHQVATAQAPLQLARASALVAFGLAQVPGNPVLLREKTRLDGLQAALDVRLAREAASAETVALGESLRRAATAGDLEKARESLQRLRTLAPNDAFTRTGAPQLLASAYLAAGERAAGNGDLARAASIAAEAVALLGDRLDLRNARARYEVAAAIDDASRAPPDPRVHAALSARLAEVAREDAEGLAALEAQLRARGALPEGGLAARLGALAPAGAVPSPVEPRAGATSRSQGSRPRPAAATGAATPVAAGASVDPEAALPPVPDGPDPCGQSGLAGRGRFCFDPIGDGRGPTFVVVPGIAGGKAYALSRAEVTVNEFNAYCQATGRCRPQPVASAAAGALPVTGIPVAQARGYARWLVHASGGWRHRLPTEAEWRHAAQAGAGWRQAPDSNCVPPTADAGSGGGPVSARGRGANPWGLINMSGNVWEWTDSGGSLAVQGGGFGSLWSDCTVEARRDDGGAAQADVGFRVLRELK